MVLLDRFEKRIYIPLPEPHARSKMFELNVGKTPCTLTSQDYMHLGQITEGYVCSVNPCFLHPAPLVDVAFIDRRSNTVLMVIARYSGSDIAIAVRDALMMPIRKVQISTHFKWVDAPSRTDPSVFTKHLTPCSPGDPFAQEMSWENVEGDQLLEPSLGMQDFLKAVKSVRPTVSSDDVVEHTKFTLEFGSEG